MREKIASLYARASDTALRILRENSPDRAAGRIQNVDVVVLTGRAFPDERIRMSYFMLGRNQSLPSEHPFVEVISMFPGGILSRSGPISAPPGPLEEPGIARDVLRKFAEEGPDRLARGVRDLLRQLLKAGIHPSELHDEVDLAVAESVMEE